MLHIARIISKAQITNGGPIILYQPENEYTNSDGSVLFPNPQYFQDVIDQARDNGVVIPLISNDAAPRGHNAPGSGLGAVDIYVCLHQRIFVSITNTDVYGRATTRTPSASTV